jgi:hypothetical protein
MEERGLERAHDEREVARVSAVFDGGMQVKRAAGCCMKTWTSSLGRSDTGCSRDGGLLFFHHVL